MAMQQLLIIFTLAVSASAARRAASSTGTAADEGENAGAEVFRAAPGVVLDGQYELKKLLRVSRGPTVSGSLLEQGRPWPKGFEILSSNYSNPSHGGEGYFGEVWLANELDTGNPVAIKLFKDGKGGYIKCGGENQVQRERNVLIRASNECSLAQRLTNGREAQRDPVGSSRIAKCLVNEVRPNLNKTEPVACYLVMENGGVSLEEWAMDHQGKGKNDPGVARLMVKQLLEAVKFLNSFDPAFIHHDLKLDNVVYTMKGGLPSVKLIDWGCAIRATDENKWSRADLRWAPPEHVDSDGKVAYLNPAHSFDMFQVGLLYMSLMCPDIIPEDEPEYDENGEEKEGPPAKTWFQGTPGPGDFLRAGCCVNNQSPGRCVTMADIDFIKRMLRVYVPRRPAPNIILQDEVFQALLDGKPPYGEAPPPPEPAKHRPNPGAAATMATADMLEAKFGRNPVRRT